MDTTGHVWLDLVDSQHPDFTTVAQLNATTAAEGEDLTAGPMDYYVARVGWWQDGSVMVQVQNRAQSVLQLLRIDPNTGTCFYLLLMCMCSVCTCYRCC